MVANITAAIIATVRVTAELSHRRRIPVAIFEDRKMGDSEESTPTVQPQEPIQPENPGANLPERDPQTLERSLDRGDLEKGDR
jgi:hypothetical protein